jgi:hypothetical protein
MSIENFGNERPGPARPKGWCGCLFAFRLIPLTRHHALSRKALRGADAPNYKRATTNLKNCYRPRPVTTCSGAEQREEPSIKCSLALKTTKLAPPDCSEFKLLTLTTTAYTQIARQMSTIYRFKFCMRGFRATVETFDYAPHTDFRQTILYIAAEIKTFSQLSGKNVCVFSVTHICRASAYHKPRGQSPACKPPF